MKIAAKDIEACVDCVMFIANDDMPEPNDGKWSPRHIEAKWPSARYYLHCDSLDADDWFSWQPCEVCGSRLGGMRSYVVALEKE